MWFYFAYLGFIYIYLLAHKSKFPIITIHRMVNSIDMELRVSPHLRGESSGGSDFWTRFHVNKARHGKGWGLMTRRRGLSEISLNLSTHSDKLSARLSLY